MTFSLSMLPPAKCPTRNTSPKHALSLEWHSPVATLDIHVAVCLVSTLFQDTTNRTSLNLESQGTQISQTSQASTPSKSGYRRMWCSALHALVPIRGIRSTLRRDMHGFPQLAPLIRAISWPCLQSRLRCPFQPCATYAP